MSVSATGDRKLAQLDGITAALDSSRPTVATTRLFLVAFLVSFSTRPTTFNVSVIQKGVGRDYRGKLPCLDLVLLMIV
jgi:hypothetical protein